MFEASMNFDLEYVEPFLTALEAHLHLGLPVADLVAFTRATAIDHESSRTLSVSFQGMQTRLDYGVFMDDIDAPDLRFETPSEGLAEAINARLFAFAEDRGL